MDAAFSHQQRKQQREAYLAALAQQKEHAKATQEDSSSVDNRVNDHGVRHTELNAKAQQQLHSNESSRRDQLYEEKRRAFLEKRRGGNSGSAVGGHSLAPALAQAPPSGVQQPIHKDTSEPHPPSSFRDPTPAFSPKKENQNISNQFPSPDPKSKMYYKPPQSAREVREKMPMPLAMPNEAKNVVVNEDMRRKREQQQEYNRQLQMDQQQRNQRPELGPQQMGEGLGIGNGNYENEHRHKREAQQKYNQALHEQQRIDEKIKRQDKTEPQLGLGIGNHGNELQSKREQQREYNLALHQQQEQQKEMQRQNSTGPQRGLGIGGFEDEETKRRKKLEKQRQYNEALHQQQEQNHRVRSHEPNAVGGLALGVDREEELRRKKEKQDAYNKGLNDQLIEKRGGERNAYQDIGGVGGLPIGMESTDEIQRKKKLQQAEYAQALDADKYRLKNKKEDSFADFIQRNHFDKMGLEDDSSSKADRQREYAAALKNDQRMANQIHDRHQHRSNSPHQYSQQQAPSSAAQFYQGIGAYDKVQDDHELKKQKQMEYASFLNNQLQMKKHQQDQERHTRGRDESDQFANSPMKMSNAEWVIGPLGVPVRKVAEVGNRGLQRMINSNHQLSYIPQSKQQHVHHQPLQYKEGAYNPSLPNPDTAFDPSVQNPPFTHGVDGVNYNSNANQLSPASRLNIPNHRGNPDDVVQDLFGAPQFGPMDLQSMRDLASKQLQVDTAKALEEQIRAKKARVAEEKEKERLAELKEDERLHRQQLEMQQRFEAEMAAQKAAADELQKRALEKQIEEKKRAKLAEEARMAQEAAKEEERIKREQEILRKQQEEEIRRERAMEQPIVPKLPLTSAVEKPSEQYQQEKRIREEENMMQEQEQISRNDTNDAQSPNKFKPLVHSTEFQIKDEKRATLWDEQPVKGVNQNRDAPKFKGSSVVRNENEGPTLFDPIVQKSSRGNSREGMNETGGASSTSLLTMSSREEELIKEAERQHKEAAAARKELADLRKLLDLKRDRERKRTPTFRNTQNEINRDDGFLVLADHHESISESLSPSKQNSQSSLLDIDEGLQRWRSARARGGDRYANVSPTKKKEKSKSPMKRRKRDNKMNIKNNEKDDLELEVFKHDADLESESRFVFPDGTSFIPNTNQQLIAAYNDDDAKESEELPDLSKIELRKEDNNRISLTSSEAKNEAEKRREVMAKAASSKVEPMEPVLEKDLLQDLGGDDAIDKEINVDNVKRKNLRKLEMLQNIGSGLIDRNGMYGEVISEDFMEQLQGVSSRPSTAGSSRPATQGLLGTSRLFAMQRAMTPNKQPVVTETPRRPLSALALSGAGSLAKLDDRKDSVSSLLDDVRNTPEVYGKNVKYPSRESLFGLPRESSDPDAELYAEFGF